MRDAPQRARTKKALLFSYSSKTISDPMPGLEEEGARCQLVDVDQAGRRSRARLTQTILPIWR